MVQRRTATGITPRLGEALPWLAAALALFVVWVVPFPGLLSGTEDRAYLRLPETRAQVAASRMAFTRAEADYRSFVGRVNMGELRLSILQTEASARNNPTGSTLQQLNETVQPLMSYLSVLEAYARAGEDYFSKLQAYDDELMAWTRSLGPRSEELRDDTFPIVEHLKLYPSPVGELQDPPYITAAQVATTSLSLQIHLNALANTSNPNPLEAVEAVRDDVDRVWASGRSIEYMTSLQDEYEQYLTTYDATVAQTATAEPSLSAERAALATASNLLLGLVTLVGFAFLLRGPQNTARHEAPR